MLLTALMKAAGPTVEKKIGEIEGIAKNFAEKGLAHVQSIDTRLAILQNQLNRIEYLLHQNGSNLASAIAGIEPCGESDSANEQFLLLEESKLK